MRKYILIAILALLSFGVSAQGLKGTWFVGGEVSFGSSKTHLTKEHKVNETMILPIVGGFVSPTVAIGAGLGYMGGKQKEDGVQVGKTNSFVFKPLVRKYWNITGGLFAFGQAAIPLVIGSGEVGANKAKYNATNFALEVSPGLDFVVNGWLTIETSFTIFSMGLNRTKPKGGSADSDFSFSANPFNSIGDRKVGDLQVGVKFLF